MGEEGDQYCSSVASKDLDWLSVEDIEKTTPKQRLEMKLATWHGRQAFIIAAWNLWEHYCRGLCERLPRQVKRDSRESFPVWVRKCLVANKRKFKDKTSFANANGLRNLIVHSGLNVGVDRMSKKNWARTKRAFTCQPYVLFRLPDGYVYLDHVVAAEMMDRVENFFEEHPLP